MTIVRSASGIRIDCDRCEEHAGAPSRSVEALRRATGYVTHGGHDLCPTCWAEATAPPADRGPTAA